MNARLSSVFLIWTSASVLVVGSPAAPPGAPDAGAACLSILPGLPRIYGGAGGLGTPATFRTGPARDRAVAAIDADGDGLPDLAVHEPESGRAWFFRGDGGGRFAEAADLDVRTRPAVVAIGDFDGDGVDDEATADPLAPSVAVWSGWRGFAPRARSSAAAPAAGAVLVADLDGDGNVDFASAPGVAASLTVCLGDGQGGVHKASAVPLAGPAASLAAADFNGDGTLDLAVSEPAAGRVSVLLGDGAGGFDLSARLAAGRQPHSIAAADWNGDGKPDLAAADQRLGEVSLFFGDGAGRFAERSILTFDPGPRAVKPAATPAVTQVAGPQVVGLTLNPATIAGGSGGVSTATVTLSAPAPAGGTLLTLASSNPELAASVLQILVPEGQATATFPVVTNARYRRYSGLAFAAAISATNPANGTSRSATLNVTAQPRPAEAVFSLDSDIKGLLCAGIQFINGEFRGDTGILFDCPLPSQGACKFKQECTLGCLTRPIQGANWNDACAAIGPFPIELNPRVVLGGNRAAGTLRLTTGAAPGSTASVVSNSLVTRASNNIPQEIPAGATSVPFELATARVDALQFAFQDAHIRTIEAGSSVFTTRHARTWAAVVPASGGETPPPIALESLSLPPPTTGGLFTAGTVAINQLAPAPGMGDVTVSLSSSDPNAAGVPASLTFPQGSNSASFGIQTSAVAADTTVTITATLPPGPLSNGSTLAGSLTVRGTPPASAVRSFFLNPSTVVGGNPVTGTVVLDGLAPPGGAVVALENGNPSVLTMPASVTVPAGADRVSFSIGTSPVAATTNVSLTARYNGTFAITTLSVTPAEPALTLSSLTLNPTSVVGGNASAGTVTLSGTVPAGSSGAVVSLTANDPAASVPPSVTVPAGASSANFTVTTAAVTAATSVTVAANFGGATRTATLTVNPAATGPLPAPSLVSPANDARFPPGATITFDWTDVAGAASYTLQIDDSDTFASPLTASQTVTASTAAIAGLPTQRLWWRVRANDAAGSPGTWSAVRRLELRN